jgi:hypothetical protein
VRGLGTIAAATAEPSAAVPGIAEHDRARLNAEAREKTQAALALGADPRTLCVHVEPGGVTVGPTSKVAAHVRKAGVTDLAKKLRRALVPTGHVLLFIDSDGATHITTVSLASLGVHPKPVAPAVFDPRSDP